MPVVCIPPLRHVIILLSQHREAIEVTRTGEFFDIGYVEGCKEPAQAR